MTAEHLVSQEIGESETSNGRHCESIRPDRQHMPEISVWLKNIFEDQTNQKDEAKGDG
jgi:hypothetical protein